MNRIKCSNDKTRQNKQNFAYLVLMVPRSDGESFYRELIVRVVNYQAFVIQDNSDDRVFDMRQLDKLVVDIDSMILKHPDPIKYKNICGIVTETLPQFRIILSRYCF